MKLSKATKKALDNACRVVVMARDNATCRRCGRAKSNGWQIHWAHIYSRAMLSLRWDTRNSMALCATCHRWQGQNPIEAGEWFVATLGEHVVSQLRLIVSTPRRPDYAAIALMLKHEATMYGANVERLGGL